LQRADIYEASIRQQAAQAQANSFGTFSACLLSFA